MPPRSAYPRSRSRIQRMPAGSRPLAGSSRISTRGFADQCGRDTQPLAHAERVVADAPVGLALGQADQLEHLVDAADGRPIMRCGEGEDLPAGASGVLGGCVQQDADLESGVGQVGEPTAQDRGAAAASAASGRP